MTIPTINHNNNQPSIHEQTIVALCTPHGAGAIALIRLSGSNTIEIVDRMSKLASNQKLSKQLTHTIHYGFVAGSDGKVLDQVLFLLMRGPRTFTGQDTVEITCHNNQFLIESIIDRALQCGARRAGSGEFTQRAVLSGKIDLLQAEAINDLIHAQTSASLDYSMQQLQGSMSEFIAQVEAHVLEIMAFCEGSFEFLDEEMEFAPDIEHKMTHLVKKVESILNSFSKQQYIKEGIKIALVGSVNVGKSSLLNCLIGKNRAIVTSVPGTTRDSIEASIFRSGDFLTFIDTAGIRKTQNQIEQQGIDRSFDEAARADIILLVIDGSKKMSSVLLQSYQQLMMQYSSKIILVFNKNDMPQINETFQMFAGAKVSVSAEKKANLDQLFQEIDKKVEELKGSKKITCLLNQRQYDLLTKFVHQLNLIKPMLQASVDYELLSYHLQESLQLLAELTGRQVSQAALDKVFSSFCVGK